MRRGGYVRILACCREKGGLAGVALDVHGLLVLLIPVVSRWKAGMGVCSTYSLELRLGRAAGSLEVALALLRGLGSLCVDSRQLGSGGADGRESGVATYVSTAHFVWCLVIWVFEGIRMDN